MKRFLTLLVLLIIVVSFGASMYYLYQKNQEDPVTYTTETPEVRTIVKKAMATGNIKPMEEVLIKPNISGVIEAVYVEGGDFVKSGDLLAKIKVVPNLSQLNDAKNQVEEARIRLQDQKRNYDRQKNLFDRGVVALADLERAQVDYDQAKLSLQATQKRYDIVRTGSTKDLGRAANTRITATVSGMVLDVPVEVGNQVIEANNFNEGTTIAAIADVSRMIFEGKVDEAEVGNVRENLPLEITIGAMKNRVFDAVLDYIAPKGVEENGAIQFEIKGTLKKEDTVFIRAGLSANASIILDRVDSTLAIREGLLQFDKDTQAPYVEVTAGDNSFERRDVKIGLSDGLYVQVLEGLNEGDKIKVWNQPQ